MMGSSSRAEYTAHIQHTVASERKRKLVKYLHGDSVEKGEMTEPINPSLHTYNEDVEDLYCKNVYQLAI